MRIAFAADIHISAKAFSEGILALSNVVKAAKAKQCSALVIAGDLLDHRIIGDGRASTGTMVAEIRDLLLDFPGEKYLLLGNHEVAGAGQKHALEVFRHLKNTTIIDTDQILQVAGHSVAFLPYISPAVFNAKNHSLSTEKRREAFQHAIDNVIERFRQAKPDIFVWHCAVMGAVANKSGYRIIGNQDTMEITADQVLSTAPICVGGDFHKRQCFNADRPNDGFLGAARQCNYGETGNPTGIRIVSMSNFEDYFLEIENIEFYKYTVAEWMENRKECDAIAAAGHHVLVEGEALPMDGLLPLSLPDGVQFKKLPPPEVIQRRSEEQYVADEDPLHLLSKWMKHTQIEIPFESVADTFRLITDGLDINMRSIGSLVRIRSIKLQNIAKHKNTNLDCSTLNGIIAIDGANGAGKTTLIEALFLACYGISASYKGQDFYGMITQGHVGDALVSVEIETSDGIFVIERTAHVSAKSKSQICTVYQIRDGQHVVVAGGAKRQAEADTFIEDLVGSKELLRSTIFAAQDGEDLISEPPAERKRRIGEMLGSDRFLPIAERAKESLRNVELKVKEIETRLSVYEELDLDKAEEALENARAKCNRVECEINKLLAQKESLLAEQARLLANSEEPLLRKELQQCEDSLRQVESDLETTKKNMEKAKRIRDEIEQLAAQESVDKAREHLEEIKKVVEQEEATREAAIKVREEKQAAIMALQAQIADKQKAYNTEMQAWQAKYDKAKADYDAQEGEMCVRISRLEVSVSNMHSKANLLKSPDIGCKGELSCIFLNDALIAKSSLERAEMHLAEAKEEYAAVDTWETAIAVAKLLALKPDQPDTTEDQKHLDALRAAMPSMPAPVNKSRLMEAEQRVTTANVRERSIASHRASLETMGDLDAVLSQHISKRNELSAVKARLHEKLAALDTGRITEVREALAVTDALLKDKNIMIADVNREIGQCEQQVKSIMEAQEKARKLLEELREKSELKNTITVILTAFSRDGIPQLILDTAIPRLAELTQTVLDAADIDSSVHFITQSVSQSGRMREVLEIQAWDSETGDYRDVLQFSGGEGTILRLAIRLGFAMLQAERGGKRISVFVADESFHALKPERALCALDMFTPLEKVFSQLFLISHQQSVVDEIKTVIYVEKEDGVSRATIRR